MDITSVLLTLVVFALVVWLCFWIIGQAFPAPVQQMARVVVGVLALLILVVWLTGHGPVLVFPLRR